MDRAKFVLALMIVILILPAAGASWFEKDYNKDVQYSKIEDLTGLVETTDTVTINVTSPVYLKVIGMDTDPWMIKNSGWYLDLYLRPDLQSDWTIVKSYTHDSYPSDEVTFDAGVTGEMRAVLYFPVVIETTLTNDLMPDDSIINCTNTSSFPSSGVIQIEDEYISYSSKSAGGFSKLTRGDRSSTVDYHPVGTKVAFFGGNFYIPVIIAIDTSSSGGGGGGAMHPSRCHALDFRISKSKTPVAVFKCMTEYCTVRVNASKSYDPDGNIVAYQWDWNGDGIYDDSGMATEHKYGTEGIHVVTLKVTDNDGVTSKWSVTVNTHFPPYDNSILSLFYIQFFGIAVWLWIIIIIVAYIGYKILAKI